MRIFNQLEFVRDEIKDLPGVEKRPGISIEGFFYRVGYAWTLGFREKELFVFGLLQWAIVGLAYYLWVQMLDWIPEEVWRSAAEAEEGSIVDVILLLWSFVCVGLAAYPIGILSACMGAVHFLHKQGKESTIAACLRIVLPQSWPVWAFHWIDGWITVTQILERLPKKNDRRTPAERALSEALYYAWKIGVSGVLPSLITGNGLIASGKNSIVFVRDNFLEVAKLRASYSAFCWIVGVGAYVFAIAMFASGDFAPHEDPVYGHIYTIYFWAGVPILLAVGAVMMFLRPVYLIALCDLYSDHLDRRGEVAALPDDPSKAASAIVAFGLLCFLVGAAYMYREELGIMDMLATPYDTRQTESREAEPEPTASGIGIYE